MQCFAWVCSRSKGREQAAAADTSLHPGRRLRTSSSRQPSQGDSVPYMGHPLGVASLVLGETGHVPFPVTEDMAIAALLHGAVEDEGGLPRLRDIQAKFGNKVAKIVEGCTDSFVEYPDKKQEWEERKSSYIERL